MKKLILSSILLLSSTITITGIHTASSRVNLWTHELKHSLYLAQNNMMSESKYYQVIDPFIKMAETRLDIPPMLEKAKKEQEDINLINEYLNCLVNYSSAYFNIYYAPPRIIIGKPSHVELVDSEGNLKYIIEKIKTKWKLDKLNVKAELERTKWIIEQANKEFYNKLPLLKRSIAQLSGNIEVGITKAILAIVY